MAVEETEMRSNRPALTLVELLVVIAIVGVLMGLLMGAVMKVRAAAISVRCRDSIRQIGLAAQHHDSTFGWLPVGCSWQGGTADQPLMSWLTRLLPQMEQAALWQEALNAYQLDRYCGAPPHLPILGKKMSIFLCQSDPRNEPALDGVRNVAFTNYLGSEGIDQYTRDGLLFVDSKIRLSEISDGTSMTVLAGERPVSGGTRFGWWYAGDGQDADGSADYVLGAREQTVDVLFNGCPNYNNRFRLGDMNNICDNLHFWSHHSGGAHFLFADGSVRFLAYSADNVLPALVTRSGNENVSVPD